MNIESRGLSASPGFLYTWWTPRLAVPVGLAAVIRLALLAASLARTGTKGLIFPDTMSYLEPGRNLLLHGRFFTDGVPELFRTPGYPLFLAITSLAGMPTASVANIILSVVSVILVWRLGRIVFDDDRIALGAAWIFAFEPVSVANSILLLSDTLFVMLYLFSLERLALFLRAHRLPVLAEAGLLLAAATFVRPVTYYLPIALALGLFFVLARVHGLRWKAPAVLLISVLPWLAAWQIRNRMEAGYGGFSSITDENLYTYSAADVIARVEHRNFIDVQNELSDRCGTGCGEPAYLNQSRTARDIEQPGWNQGWRLSFMHAEAVRVIRAHSGVYLRASLASLSGVVLNPGAGIYINLLYPEGAGHADSLTDYKSPASGALALAKAYPWIAAEKAVFVTVLLGMYLLAAWGTFRGGMHNECIWLLLGTSLYFFVVSDLAGGPGGTARYRLPVMPAVCILVAAGVWSTKTITAQRHTGFTRT
jgi:hypothetical protein